ncbi:MAG: hypothetical protein HQM12_00310 [SAR324 cluster bacterium]|nr:hypothetical protein [SAR324 cluster bacterium]
MKCPVCHAPYRGKPVCTRCQCDLTPLLQIRNNAVFFYNQAVMAARQEHWHEALRLVDQALEWFSAQAEFHLLRGKLLAQLHRYQEIIPAWKTALRYDPDSQRTQTALEAFQHLLKSTYAALET